MRINRRWRLLLALAMTGCVTCGCTTDSTGATSGLPASPSSASSQSQTALSSPQAGGSLAPELAREGQAALPADLRQLAERFVRYAAGVADTFPHGESVSMSLGGEPILSIDDIVAALANRAIWQVCPEGWDRYGASSCPVNLLSPITDAVVNNATLVYSRRFGDVTCAPTRAGPLPSGRLVILRPTREWRTCASDFALVLAADSQGRLRSIDLTLSAP